MKSALNAPQFEQMGLCSFKDEERQRDTLLIPQGKLLCYSSMIKSHRCPVRVLYWESAGMYVILQQWWKKPRKVKMKLVKNSKIKTDIV